jgi:hypothetical protein
MRISLSAAVLIGVLLGAAGAGAQREFVEEVDPPRKKAKFDAVDLDAPDPAEEPVKKPIEPVEGGSSPGKADPKADPDASAKADAGPAATGKGPAAPDAGPGANPKADPKASATSPAAPTPDGGDIQVLETSYAALLEKWDPRAHAVAKGEVARARKLLPDVNEALLDFGVQGVPGGFQATGFATALLREGRRALDEGNLEEATALVEAAERAAPDLVAVHTQAALLKWRGGDVGATVNALLLAAKTHLRDPLALSQVAARAILLVALVWVALLVGCALLVGLPALRYLSFDLLQGLPRGAHGGQVFALVVMAAFVPVVVGAGPVFGAMWILTLAWLYLSLRARVVVAVLALACLALPVAFDQAARLLAYPGSRADRAHRALFDANAESLRVALQKRVVGELDVWEQAALASAAKREGRLEEAARRWEELLAKHDVPFAHGGAGVVAALRGDDALALQELGKAGTPAAHFNASTVHFRAGASDKAESTIAPLSQVPEQLNAFRRTTFRAPDQAVGQNRAFVDVYPDPLELLRAGLQPSAESAAVATDMSELLLRGEQGTRALAALVAFPLAWLALTVLRRKLLPCQACVRCGHPASRRVDGPEVPEDTCAQCFHAFLSTRSRVDGGVKLRKERQINARSQRIGRSIVILGLLWPGTGHLFGGAILRGVVFTALHGSLLAGLVLALGWLPMPRLEGPWGNTLPAAVVGGLLAVVWLLAARSGWVLADDFGRRNRTFKAPVRTGPPEKKPASPSQEKPPEEGGL